MSLLFEPTSLTSRRSRILGVAAIFVPLLLYIPLIALSAPDDATRNLIVTIFNYDLLPSPGFPFYWALNLLPARLAFGTSHFNVTLLTSALPVALTSWLLYRAERHLDVSAPLALFASLIWATGSGTIALATHASPHALSALYLSALVYASLRYIKDPSELSWLFRFAAFAALGAAHQISFLAAWLSLGLMFVLTEWRLVLRFKLMLGLFAVALLTPALYMLLWVAGYPDVSPGIDYIIVKDRLLSHVHEKNLGPGLILFWKQWFLHMFLGAPLLAGVGVWHMTSKSWPRRWLLVVLSLLSPPVVLLWIADHPEASSFIAAWLAPLSIFTALGLQHLVELDFWQRSTRNKLMGGVLVVMALVLVGFHMYQALAVLM